MQRNKLLLLLALLLTAATGAWAQNQWDSGDCTVTLSGDVMTVSGAGAMANYADSYALPWYGNYIKTIVIESGVTSIGNSAFAKCYNLESVSIPASVTSIGSQAFEDCGYEADAALTVSFAEGSTPLTIGEYAFQDANLKSIDIPNRVTSIGNGAFTSCRKLESVSIPASVTSIGNFAFQSCGSEAEALTVSFAEGSTLESIGEGTFLEAKLTSINIPNSVTSIGTFAFSGCSNLESVSIPASVTSIGYNAFSSCSKLESVSIPASVTSISEGAFRYCGMLAKVYIYAPSLTTYGANAFASNATGRKIYVPADAVDTYKAGWSAYAADIEAMTLTLYATSVKEGTEDADKWTINPNPAAEGQTVTATYSGTRRVKSVKAVKKAAAAAKTLAEVTAGDIGKIVGKDGKIYATKADAEAVATGNAVAMIAYVGSASDCTHGLAIALADESGTKTYGDAGTACSGKAAVTGGTWRLPSIKDWQYMLIGCGASGSYSDNPNQMSCSELASKLNTAQGDALQTGYYWSSTEAGTDYVWTVYFGGDYAPFYDVWEGFEYRVRACLAFTVEQSAKEPATVTTAPQAKTDVEAGSTTALIEAGVADGGSMMYAVTTTNTKPTSTDGFSASVPTAQTITASGKVYVWYYVKGDDTHTDSEIAGPITVTLNNNVIPGSDPYTPGGDPFSF